jgi:hypothetical protein
MLPPCPTGVQNPPNLPRGSFWFSGSRVRRTQGAHRRAARRTLKVGCTAGRGPRVPPRVCVPAPLSTARAPSCGDHGVTLAIPSSHYSIRCHLSAGTEIVLCFFARPPVESGPATADATWDNATREIPRREDTPRRRRAGQQGADCDADGQHERGVTQLPQPFFRRAVAFTQHPSPPSKPKLSIPPF